jgi:hypothetical protein
MLPGQAQDFVEDFAFRVLLFLCWQLDGFNHLYRNFGVSLGNRFINTAMLGANLQNIAVILRCLNSEECHLVEYLIQETSAISCQNSQPIDDENDNPSQEVEN